jgi:hypothetical protein
MILNSPYISGSLTVTGNTTIQGQLTVTGSLSGTASLASNALLLQGTGSTGFATTASFLQVSSSQQEISSSLLQVSASYISLSGSYNVFSGSNSTILTAVSSSQQQISASLLNVIAIGATTGSNSFRADQSITGSLVVTGQIVAQSINIQQVTSSIIYSSGSNVFGCDINSRQTFTGSFFQTGSLASFSGQLCVGSSLVLGTNNAYALYLRDSAGNPKPIIATAGNTNLNFYNVCSTGKVNINNAADNAVLVSIDNTGASTFSGQLCSITGVFGAKGGGNYGVLISDNDQSNVRLRFTNTGTGGTSMSIVGGNPGLSNSGLAIYDETNAATRMYITSCGNVGIGTISPKSYSSLTTNGQIIALNNIGIDAGQSFRLNNYYNSGTVTDRTISNGYAASVGLDNSVGALTFNTSLTCVSADNNVTVSERMRITNCGKVGIIATDPKWLLEICCNTTATGGGGYPAISINNPNDAGYSALYFFKGANNFGGLELSNATCHLFINTACTFAIQTNNTERLRVTSGGIIQLGSSSERRNALQQSTFGYGGAYRTLLIGSTGTDYTTNAVTLAFNVDLSGNPSGAYGGDGTEYFWRNVGSFKTPNSSNNGYNTLLSWNSSGVVTVTTSDYRTKEDLKSFEALPMIQAMKLYDFRWIELQNRMHGVLAHELQDIVPYAVMGEKDGESMQGVDYSKLVPILVKGMQEQQCLINTLKTCLGIV